MKLHKSLFSYLVVGGLAAVINFSAFGFCWQLMHLNYKLAISIAFILSVMFHFTANRRFTFQSQHIAVRLQIPRYLSMVAVNYVVTLIVMQVVVEILHLSPYLGTVAAIGMTVGSGYIMSRYWVFV